MTVTSNDAENPAANGLGSPISAPFAHIRLEEPIGDWQSQIALSAAFAGRGGVRAALWSGGTSSLVGIARSLQQNNITPAFLNINPQTYILKS